MGIAMEELYEENYNLREENQRLLNEIHDKRIYKVNLVLGGFFAGIALMIIIILTN